MRKRKGLFSGRGVGLALLCAGPCLALGVYFFQRYFPESWVWMDASNRPGGGIGRHPGSLGNLVGLSVGLVLALWLAGSLAGPRPKAPAQEAAGQPGCLGILLILAASGILMRPLAWALKTSAGWDIATWGHGLAFLWIALVFLGFALLPILRRVGSWLQRN